MKTKEPKIKITPIGDRVLVTMIDEETKVGLLYIPDTAKNPPCKAKVVHLGDGNRTDGTKVVWPFKAGDTVIVSKYGGTEMKVGGVEHRLYALDEVQAKVEVVE